MEKHSRKHSILSGMILFLLLTCFILTVFRRMDPEIFKVLRTVPVFWILFLFLIDCIYQFMEALVCKAILKNRMAHFRLRNGLDVTFIGVFANVATPFGGRIPMQSFYLYHRGLMAGSGLGLMSVEYLFHKIAVLLCATLALVADWRWIHSYLPNLSPYLLLAYGICMIIILWILLICTWHRVKEMALWLIGKLPDKGKWADRKAHWRENIEVLYEETHTIMQNKKELVNIFLIEIVKLTVLYTIPALTGWILGIGQTGGLHILGLSAIMFMLSNALPNLSGMGAVEFSFFFIFSGIFGELTLTALLLYRIATYYMPFLMSCIWFPCISYHSIQK